MKQENYSIKLLSEKHTWMWRQSGRWTPHSGSPNIITEKKAKEWYRGVYRTKDRCILLIIGELRNPKILVTFLKDTFICEYFYWKFAEYPYFYCDGGLSNITGGLDFDNPDTVFITNPDIKEIDPKIRNKAHTSILYNLPNKKKTTTIYQEGFKTQQNERSYADINYHQLTYPTFENALDAVKQIENFREKHLADIPGSHPPGYFHEKYDDAPHLII
jgi:hypothetical protein